MAEFYDTHAHLDYQDFAADLEGVLDRAHAAGITRIITIGTDLESSRRAVALCDRVASLYAAVGWHPSYATGAPADLRPELRQLAAHPKVVAIGETGLDHHRLPSKQPGGDPAADLPIKRKQAEILAQQLEVAAELGLNCIIHERDSFDDLVTQLRPWKGRLRAVFHCFGKSPTEARQVLEMGFLVSFTGILTFKNGQNVRDSLGVVPLGQFMLETDCPFLAPIPYRGKRCEPAYVREIAAVAAQVKGCTLEELSAATCATAHGFFRGLGQAPGLTAASPAPRR
jgi:TatD DNase family protein